MSVGMRRREEGSFGGRDFPAFIKIGLVPNFSPLGLLYISNFDKKISLPS
jgi:hypothetical protein